MNKPYWQRKGREISQTSYCPGRMTDAQRITLMADWWPEACENQGWNKNDRALRLRVFSEAVGRDILSASDLNTTTDIDRVKAHLGKLSDKLKETRETLEDGPAIGRARRLRDKIRERLRCLAIYLDPPTPETAALYLAEIIKDKFKHGSRAMPLTLDDLSAEPERFWQRGTPREIPGQLDQVLFTLDRNIQKRRTAASHTIHDMKIRAGVPCDCKTFCQRVQRISPALAAALGLPANHPATPSTVLAENEPW